jgi:CubicO group peptidase (beta-lactamase class C family)
MQNIIDEIQKNYPHIKAAYATQQNSPLFEYYRDDVNNRTLLRIASATKSFVAALVGVALQQGFIQSVDQTVEDLASWDKTANIAPELREITLRYLLTMTSGINWPPPRIEFLPKFDDVRILEELSLADPPGKTFAYKPDVHLVARLLEDISGTTLNHFVERYLFEPLGIERYAWNLVFQGYEGLWLRICDFWKLGQLYLQKGVWNGVSLIAKEYVETSTSPLVAGGFPEHAHYGYYWWVTSIGGKHAFYASGFGGQYLVVVPEIEMVVAMLSEMDQPHLENRTLIFEYIDSYFKSTTT